MRKKISNLKSRILLVLLSATIILTSFSLGVFAAPGDAQRAAEAQFWLNAMRHCISRSSNIVGYTGSELESGDIFMYTGGKSYYVGQYYEEQYGDHHFLGFGDDDGQMDCDESSSAIANAFAQSIGLENGVADLICDKYDNGRTGGLYVRQKMTDGHFTPNDQACSEFGSDTFLLADDAMEYLQKLYNEYVDNLDTSAAVRWEDINDVSEIEYFNSVSGYAMYKREFDKYCNGGEVRNQDYNVPNTGIPN